MNAASVNTGNAARVARAFLGNTSATPLRDRSFLTELDSLRKAIESASHATVGDPQSESRKSMRVLANLAAYHGPMGDAAREELCDLYLNPPEEMSGEVRDQLLNSALEMCMAFEGGLEELEATVLVMAGFAPESPVGENGEGPRSRLNQALALKLGEEFGAEPLAKDRVPTSTELMAAGAQLKNLNWSEPASIATPEAARQSFDRVLSEVATQKNTLVIWVAGADGHCVPVVAQPTPSGGIRFHVIAEDKAGNQVGKHLAELSDDDCVIVHQVEDAHIALKHLDANFHDERGAGGVLREHTDNWSAMEAADQQAAKLVSQAEMYQAVAADKRSNPQPPDIVMRAPNAVPSAVQVNAIAQPLPSTPVPERTPAQKFAAQNLRIVATPGTDGSGDPRISLQIESPVTRLANAINAMDTMTDPRPRIRAEGQLKFDSAIAELQSQGVDAAYIRRIHANIDIFKEIDKKPWLATTGPGLLRPAASALIATASKAAFTQFVTRRSMLLDTVYREIAKGEGKTNQAALKKAVEELTTTEDMFFANIEKAITEFGGISNPTPEASLAWKKAGIADKQATQIKEDAKTTVAALRELQALGTHDIFKAYKETFYGSTDESLSALTDTIRALPEPVAPTPIDFSTAASAAGFGRSLDPDSELSKAMAQVRTVQEKPAARSVFGRPFDKAPFASFGSPKELEEVLKQATSAAEAVENAPNRPTAMRAFNAKLAATKRYVDRQLDDIHQSIKRLDDIQKSSAGQNVKADAREMRAALEKLRTEWERAEGLPQKIGKLCGLGALYPEEARVALIASAGARAAD